MTCRHNNPFDRFIYHTKKRLDGKFDWKVVEQIPNGPNQYWTQRLYDAGVSETRAKATTCARRALRKAFNRDDNWEMPL